MVPLIHLRFFLWLSVNAKYINSLGPYLEKLHTDVCALDVTSIKECQMIESFNYEFQRHKISGYIKANHKLDYPLFSNADVVFINSYLIRKHTFLKFYDQTKQLLSQVDAVTTVY